MTAITVTLGRDGATLDNETEWNAWVAFVCDRIDEATGLNVDVDERGVRDVQTDAVSGGTEEQQSAVREALAELWERFSEEEPAAAT